jgi:Putative beta-barrel porin-2, OmpL-like. bbp2
MSCGGNFLARNVPSGALAWPLWTLAILIVLTTGAAGLRAQSGNGRQSSPTADVLQAMQARIGNLETEVAELKAIIRELRPSVSGSAAASLAVSPSAPAADAPTVVSSASLQTDGKQVTAQQNPQNSLQGQDRKILDFLRQTSIDVGLDGYYAYNFNHPVGRVNELRAYDVLSNEFSLNQANVIFEHPPDVSAGRRWGGRLDLQFGQATDTLQGNPANEPRPEIYRNVFQAYGTYVAPFGKGLTVDFGKWGSSIGIEGNYTKDQVNYSRAYWFDFLPFYHMGLRVSYALSDRFAVNYWVVNGTNQVEATNGFKDELFGFTVKPRKNITWTMNYYLGQEHPDRVVVTPSSPIPVQPGLSFQAIRPAPNGRTHIVDSYITWQATSKLSVSLEGDYFLQRLWRNQAPGESAALSHVGGGVAYVRYQLTPKIALGTRAEYLSDRGGLFSGLTQALKENTVTLDYAVADGFLMRYEWRRDYSNQPSFLSDVQGVLSKEQTTATVGLMWWWGRKEGAW